MEDEFADALLMRLAEVLSDEDVEPTERVAAYADGGPRAGQVVYNVEYQDSGSPNAKLIGVAVTIDVWTKGPDGGEADRLASLIESGLVDWSVATARQGTVRLIRFARAQVNETEEKLARVTMRLTGRAFRRL